jgi:hypothetical protein
MLVVHRSGYLAGLQLPDRPNSRFPRIRGCASALATEVESLRRDDRCTGGIALGSPSLGR